MARERREGEMRPQTRVSGRLLAVVSAVAVWQASGPAVRAQAEAPSRAELAVVEVRPNVYMIAGAGGNVTVYIGPDGAIVVDTGRADAADAVLAEIKRLTPQPIRYIINTNADPDHVGGNGPVSSAGQPLYYRLGDAPVGPVAPILAEEHVLARMSAPAGDKARLPEQAWPSSTYAAAAGETQRKLVMSREAVQVMYQPAAHTDGDSLVYFRRSDVLVAGDVLDVTRFPVIDRARGGSIQGVVDSLNRIIEMAFSSTPFPWQDDGTRIVPGHGRLCGTDDVVNYRDMVVIVRDRVAALIEQGRTLEEIQQANPTAGYRREYGSDTGSWTTRMFVEAVYRSLLAAQGGTR